MARGAERLMGDLAEVEVKDVRDRKELIVAGLSGRLAKSATNSPDFIFTGLSGRVRCSGFTLTLATASTIPTASTASTVATASTTSTASTASTDSTDSTTSTASSASPGSAPREDTESTDRPSSLAAEGAAVGPDLDIIGLRGSGISFGGNLAFSAGLSGKAIDSGLTLALAPAPAPRTLDLSSAPWR